MNIHPRFGRKTGPILLTPALEWRIIVISRIEYILSIAEKPVVDRGQINSTSLLRYRSCWLRLRRWDRDRYKIRYSARYDRIILITMV